MAKELFNSDFYTLPEQVQLNKEDIETLKTKIDTNTNSIDSIKQLYLLKTDASNTYATKTELSSYLSIADASNTYLTKSYASSNYLTIHDAFNIYLNKTDASNTYLTKTDASNTYATQEHVSNFDSRINTLEIQVNNFNISRTNVYITLNATGLAKIESNVIINSPIILTKTNDYTPNYENYNDFGALYVFLNIYTDATKDYSLSKYGTLIVSRTGPKNEEKSWFTGIIPVILGPSKTPYLCCISYDKTLEIMTINPIQPIG